MTRFEGEPLSPLDAEIETLLLRLAALETHSPTEEERPIREIALAAIRDRLAELSRKCTDRTCRIRVMKEAKRKAAN